MSISDHIHEIQNELDSDYINKQRKRHLIDELDLLISYQNNHPDEDYDPTSLELYCDKNPDALECKMFDL